MYSVSTAGDAGIPTISQVSFASVTDTDTTCNPEGNAGLVLQDNASRPLLLNLISLVATAHCSLRFEYDLYQPISGL